MPFRFAAFAPRVILLAVLAACAACANTPDTLVGTWKLTSPTCDGTLAKALGSTFDVANYTFTITYKDTGSFTSTLKLPSCSLITFNGTYSREGLDVTEHQTTTACGTGCILYVPCQGISGTIPTVGTHQFRLNLQNESTLEQIRHSPNSFCTTAQKESQVFTLQ